jgi:hypothetical protein
MNYIDFAIASSIFIIFFGVALMFSTNYFSNLSSLTKTSEFRSISENFFKIFFESKGTPENWDDYSNTPVKIGLAEDLYKIPILLKETSGYNRTNEFISRHIVFDENCENKTWNDTIRIFDENYNEFVYKLSDETFCSSQYLKEANITWEVNVSANQTKKFLIYYSSENNVNHPTFMSNLTVVGVWHLDEGSGSTTYDETGNNNDGTLYNGTEVSFQEPAWTSSCHSGNCLSFDGSNDYVDLGNNASLKLSQGGSLEAWFKINQFASGYGNTIIMKGDGPNWANLHYILFQDSGTNNIILSVSDGATHGREGPTTSNLIKDTWYHVVGTWNDTTKCIYINGSLEQCVSSNVMPKDTMTSCKVFIGKTHSNYYFFNGTIDEVKIYNRALSAEEINASYYASPLVKKIFPEEKITAVSANKFDALKNISYDEARKTVGENYKFRLEVGNETYGGNVNMSSNVGCSEYPKIVEYKNGTVSKTMTKMCVWK